MDPRFIFRYHASLMLKRMNTQEQGEYTFHAKSALTNASITFQVKMYRKYKTQSRTFQRDLLPFNSIETHSQQK